MNDLSETSPKAGGFTGLLRVTTLTATVIGAVVAEIFTLRAGQSSPRLLLVLFIIWVFSPFAGLLWVMMASKRWSAVTRTTLYCVAMIVALVSLAVYSGLVVVKPAGSANAFLFVIVPLVSWILMVIVAALAALISRMLSRGGTGA